MQLGALTPSIRILAVSWVPTPHHSDALGRRTPSKVTPDEVAVQSRLVVSDGWRAITAVVWGRSNTFLVHPCAHTGEIATASPQSHGREPGACGQP